MRWCTDGRTKFAPTQGSLWSARFSCLPCVKGGAEAIAKAEEIVSPLFNYDAFLQRLQSFLSAKINPSDWLSWYIENFPESKKIMRNNPEFQYSFK